MELAALIADQFQQNTMPELAAAILAIAYLLLAVRQRIECWYAALASTAIFLFIFWRVDLYMEAGLQVYYLAMAVYGWWHWQHPGDQHHETLQVSTWHWTRHLAALSLIATATLVSGYLLSGTDQRMPYLDSFTTWGAVVATFMVTRKILENWIYWLVIDAAAIYLYLDRALYFTVLLFAVYIVIIFFGFAAWLKDYRSAHPQIS